MNVKNRSAIIMLRAETHIHSGIGQAAGALDLPVARERVTHYPVLPGTGVKGAFRVWASEQASLDDSKANKLFGNPTGSNNLDEGGAEGAGELLLSDGRLLFLPVRCTSEAFKWVTCPAILNRFRRDCKRAGITDAFKVPFDALSSISVKDNKYLGKDQSSIGLEERDFEHEKGFDASTEAFFAALGTYVDLENLVERLVILSDNDFTWFARYALPIMARNKLDNNKKSENLWYEEALAPDTIMYLLFAERKSGSLAVMLPAIEESLYIQIGGNETVGQGWFQMFACPRADNKGD